MTLLDIGHAIVLSPRPMQPRRLNIVLAPLLHMGPEGYVYRPQRGEDNTLRAGRLLRDATRCE